MIKGQTLSNIIGNPDYRFRVAMGLVKGSSVVDKFGTNPIITTLTDPADIWEQGGLYIYDDDNTAPILYLSSSIVGNTQTIKVSGLDINGDEVIQDIVLDGQNNVNLDTALWRVYRMVNISSTSPAGKIYCHTDPTPGSGVPAVANIRALIDNSHPQPHNQTLMSLYTVPKGKVGFLVRGEIGLKMQGSPASIVEYCHFHYQSRRFGGVFTVKKAVDCIIGGSAIYQDDRSFPDIIPALTDIRLTAIEVTETMGVWGTFDLLLEDENKFSDSWLQKIGQPGH